MQDILLYTALLLIGLTTLAIMWSGLSILVHSTLKLILNGVDKNYSERNLFLIVSVGLFFLITGVLGYSLWTVFI